MTVSSGPSPSSPVDSTTDHIASNGDADDARGGPSETNNRCPQALQSAINPASASGTVSERPQYEQSNLIGMTIPGRFTGSVADDIEGPFPVADHHRPQFPLDREGAGGST